MDNKADLLSKLELECKNCKKCNLYKTRTNVVFADERAAHGADVASTVSGVKYVLVGPEGGFADDEFCALDSAGARGISLGKTILRAELAAAIAIAKVVK